MSEKLFKEEELQEEKEFKEEEELEEDYDDDNINYYEEINENDTNNNTNNNTNNTINKEANEIFYEVCFKCYTSIYGSFEVREKGDMVIVHCNRGYNIGFILREVNHEELIMNDGSIYKPKKILSHIKDGDETIKNILRSKISAEIFALSKSKLFMKGHKLAELTLPMTTEFQFDRKKLTVYLKKYEEISVCRLVRRLYDTFKMRIKVIEVESFEILQEKVQMYLDVSKLNITLNDVFNSDGSLCAGPFLNLLHSQHEKRSSPKNSNNSRLPHSHYTFQNTMVQSNSLNINGVSNSTIPIGSERDRERERIGERADLGIIGSRNSINSSSTLNNSNNNSSSLSLSATTTTGSTLTSSSSIYLKNHRNSPTQSSLSLTNNLMNGNSIAGVTNTAAASTTNDYYRSIDQDAYWDHSNGYSDQRYLPTLQLPTKSSYTRSYPKYPIGNDLASDMAKYRTNLTTSLSLPPPPPSLSSSSTTTTLSTSQHNTVSYPSEQLSSHYNDISPTSTTSIENKFFFDEFHDHSNDHHIQPSYHHQQISNLQYLNQYHHQHQHHPSSSSTAATTTFHHSKLPISPKSSSSTSSNNMSNSNSQYSHHSGTTHGYSQPQYQYQHQHQNQNQQYYHHFQQPNHHQHHQMSQNYNKSYNSNAPMKSYYSQLQSGYDSNQTTTTTTQTSFSGYQIYNFS